MRVSVCICAGGETTFATEGLAREFPREKMRIRHLNKIDVFGAQLENKIDVYKAY